MRLQLHRECLWCVKRGEMIVVSYEMCQSDIRMSLLSVTINTIDLNYVMKSQILNLISRKLLYRNAFQYQSPLWFHLDKTMLIRRESESLYQDGTKEDSNITKRSYNVREITYNSDESTLITINASIYSIKIFTIKQQIS